MQSRPCTRPCTCGTEQRGRQPWTKASNLQALFWKQGQKAGALREKHPFSSRKAPFLENCPSGGCGRRGVKHAAKAKKVWPLVTLLSPSLSLSGFGRPLNTPAAFHVHKCQGGIAPARAAAPPLRPRLLLFACQRSHSSAGQAFLSGAQVKDKIVVGSVSLNLWAEGAHHSLKARLKAVRCERPRLPRSCRTTYLHCQTSAPHPLQVHNTSNATQTSRPHNAQNRPEAKGVISPGTGTRIKEKDCWHFLNFHPHAPNHSHISRAALRCTIPHPTPADPLALTSSNRPNSVPSTARLVYKCMPATCDATL